MAFIFTPEHDPRRDNMNTFPAGSKVRYAGMSMPAEIISGPHKTVGTRQRYLIRKADGNVSLVPDTELERIVPRLDQVAGTLAVLLYGRSFVNLDRHAQTKLANAAARAIAIADNTRAQA